MRALVSTPVEVLVDLPITKAELTVSIGQMVLLPRPADIAVAVMPGISTLVDETNAVLYLAHGEGTLVKAGDKVRVAIGIGTVAQTLASLEARLRGGEARYKTEEQRSTSAGTQLELGLIRKLIELQKGRHDG